MGNQFRSSTYSLLEQENIIESILFMMGESVSVDTLATAIESSVDVAKDAAERLYSKYQGEYQDRGMKVIKLGSKYQMVSNNKYFKNLVLVASHPQKPVITESILETLSIIAYKQPISKPEIENIRGVKSDYACNRLLEYGLIEEKGRLETAGRPILFGTTEEFMLRFGIESLDELPILDATKFAEIENEVEKELSETLGEPVVLDKDLYTENVTTNLKSELENVNGSNNEIDNLNIDKKINDLDNEEKEDLESNLYGSENTNIEIEKEIEDIDDEITNTEEEIIHIDDETANYDGEIKETYDETEDTEEEVMDTYSEVADNEEEIIDTYDEPKDFEDESAEIEEENAYNNIENDNKIFDNTNNEAKDTTDTNDLDNFTKREAPR